MDRQEFLETLGRALKRELTEEEVMDNIRYYEEYIDREMRNGKSEEQVLRELGDPRLIARTILQVDQQKEEAQERSHGYDSREYGYGSYDSNESVYTEDADGGYANVYPEEDTSFRGKIKMRTYKIRGWLILLLVLAVICLVLGTVFAVLWKLLPLILIVAAVSWLYHRFFE
jgi:uncharacterized membrane protein